MVINTLVDHDHDTRHRHDVLTKACDFSKTPIAGFHIHIKLNSVTHVNTLKVT